MSKTVLVGTSHGHYKKKHPPPPPLNQFRGRYIIELVESILTNQNLSFRAFITVQKIFSEVGLNFDYFLDEIVHLTPSHHKSKFFMRLVDALHAKKTTIAHFK